MATATLDRHPGSSRFGATIALAMVIGAMTAAIIAPLAAYLLARAGFHLPFPRIFDRVAMVTLAGALILFARRLRLRQLIVEGFLEPRGHLLHLFAAFASALTAIFLLASLAI